jgi:hypothetical protein
VGGTLLGGGGVVVGAGGGELPGTIGGIPGLPPVAEIDPLPPESPLLEESEDA